jgi:NitT/TauT family transport system substrate-binding protein
METKKMKKLFGVLLVLSVHHARAEEISITVGITNTSSEVGLYIAQEKGYFGDAGIHVATIAFSSATQMIAPLGTGELSVGSGSATAGLYNAVARGIPIRIVADGASAPPGYGHNILLVRKALIESGRFKSVADLKGMHVALTAVGASSTAMLNTVLQTAGLRFGDVDPVYLGYPDHVIALATGKVDAALTAEPSATQAVAAGSAVRITSEDVFSPYHVGSVILYSGTFANEHKEAAQRFMTAYVKAIRYYNDALTGGRLAGPHAEEIIGILTKSTTVKDPQIYREITPQGCDPDGIPSTEALKQDFDFYKSQGWINGNAGFEQAIDLSFVRAADRTLGAYKKN